MCKWMKKKKGEKATDVDETHVQVQKAIFIHFGASVFYPQFSPHFGEKTFWWAQEKTLGPYHIFFPLSLPTKHPLKLLSLHFSLLNFPSSLKSLQTINGEREREREKYNAPMVIKINCILFFSLEEFPTVSQ